MAGIVTLRRSWGRTKPPCGTPISPGHPLAWGLAGAWLLAEAGGAASANPAAPGRNPLAWSGGYTWGSGPAGPRVTLNGSTGYGSAGVIPGLAGAARASIFAVGRRDSGALWTLGDGAVTSGRTNVLIYSDNTCYCQFENGGSAFPNFAFGGTAAFSIGVAYDAATSGLLAAYRDGLPVTLSPGGTIGSSLAGTGAWEIGREAANGRYQAGDTEICYLWVGRTLSPADFAALHRDPYALFAPPSPRRVAVPAATAAGMVALPPTRRLRNRTTVRM